jgi:RND superfamily putative drug exporter
MHEPITSTSTATGTVANITVPIEGNGTDAASNAALARCATTIVPRDVGALPASRPASPADRRVEGLQRRQMKSKLPLVSRSCSLFAFALMLVAFRSIVVAAQGDRAQPALGRRRLRRARARLPARHRQGPARLQLHGRDRPVVPLLLFVILFGLSMDYHVFIISRIRETFDRGASMDDAIAHGIKSTAGVVTSAAIVMVAVFSIFATLSMLIFKQFGVGLAAAILIDATIVRACSCRRR